jgi:hypothetical protein
MAYEPTIFIYGLLDPFESLIRYVGRSYDPDNRLTGYMGHLYEAKIGIQNHKCNWIREVLSKEGIPLILILEVCSEDDWSECERKWIKCLRDRGYPLTNIADGGEGGWYVPIESRRVAARKMNAINKLRGVTPERKEQCRQLGLSCKDVPKPPEVRQKISQTLKAIYAVEGVHSPFYECHHTDEAKKVMSDKKKIAYLGEGNPFFGKHHNEESRQQIGINSGLARTGKKRGPYKTKPKVACPHCGKLCGYGAGLGQHVKTRHQSVV